MVVSRAGLATMGIADVAMLARYEPSELAWLSLAEGTLGRFLDVAIAFLIGGLSLVPRFAAKGDLAMAGQLWRRTIPVSLLLGLLAIAVGTRGEALLLLLGQRPELATEAAAVMRILALGYPAALVAIASSVYLEGVNRPQPVAFAVLLANGLNIGLNWLLIGGQSGLPAMGAEGSAWATTVVRCVLGVALATLAWRVRGQAVANLPACAPIQASTERQATAQNQSNEGNTLLSGSTAVSTLPSPSVPLNAPTPTNDALCNAQAADADHRMQWRLGLGAAGTIASMVVLSSPLTLLAGQLGVLPLAAFSAAWNLAAPAGLIALGMSDAAGIYVASTAGQSGERAAATVAWACLRFTMVPMAVLSACFALLGGTIADWYSGTIALRNEMVPTLPLVAALLLVDAGGFVMAASLRAVKEVAWPLAIEIGSLLLLAPLATGLAWYAGMGVRGLFLAMLTSALLRVLFLSLRFWWRSRVATLASDLETSCRTM